MNALWIARMCAYKNSSESLESAKHIVEAKVRRQSILLKKYGRPGIGLSLDDARTIPQILLEEARAAKTFWREFRTLMPPYANFRNRTPHARDVGNRLLDIGYRHLTNIIRKLLEAHDTSPALGLLHSPRKSASAPLAYDLVELFRSDIVDAEVLRFLRLKKRPFEFDQSETGHFVHELNERLEKNFYLKDFKSCRTYRYYMELQILKFIGAVDHRKAFEPLHLPARHDTRCLTLPVREVVSSQVP